MRKTILSMLLLLLLGMTGSMTAMAEVVEIGSAEDLNTFAQLVATGMEVDGVLTADIDLSTSDYPDLMIGSEEAPFTRTFDGRGHTITYHYEMVTEKWRGLFAYIDGATIRDLIVEGSAVSTNIHYGALIGVAHGTVLVEQVVTNVDITGQRSGVTGDAGMLGANYADITFNNCAVLGPLGYPGSSMYSPYSGWSNGSSKTTLNNCYAASEFKEGTGIDGNSATLSHGGGPNVFNNCYYLNYIDKVQGTQVTEEQIANGSLCYKLNGNQTDIVWTQTIGVDPFPMPNPEGKRVYASGTCRCDGAELEDNPLTYTNTESYPVIPDHKYSTDGICSVCGMADPNAVQQDENGFYLIGNADQLHWLNLKVQESNNELKALLTDDIDLNNCIDPDLMIGTESRPFHGIFDGGGHTITYDYAAVTEKWRGLFAFVKDATIRNLRVEGSAYVTQIHYGALIGRGNGTILVENVVTNVDITGAMNQVTGDGGMIGANYADITFNNCATLGEMGYAEDGKVSSMYSPFSGWSDGNSCTTLNNCYSTCKLKEGTSSSNCFTLTHQNGTVTINNSYYLHVLGRVLSGERIHQSQITEEQLESGELCYMLNGDQTEIGWYQNLNDDEMPVPNSSHLRVYGAGDTYMNITDDASFREFVSLVIEGEKEAYEEVVAQKSLIETYLADLEALEDMPNIEAFMAGYNELADQRESIRSCAEAYAAFIAKVEETINYMTDHPELDNEKAQQLKTYRMEYEEPSEDFPYGSAEYIIENCLLSEEEIIAETTLIDEKLVEAITSTPAVGTEITMLFTNADLSDRFNGWEGVLPTGWGGSETSPLYAAECLAAKMDMYQTLSGLPNGIYELQVNGAFRPTPYNDYYNVNYAATLYANGVHNYFQTNIEDMIDVEDAIDGVNCNITGPVADFAIEEDGEVIGYTMQGIVSCCNAFQGGRYPNSVLCNVTDGTLTIGIRQPGSGQQPDWLGFGNIKVIYWGEMNEANEGLDHVLASQADRASTILDTYQFSYGLDYATYPNFSQALKDELRQTLEAVDTTTQPAAKYQLIERFSSLFLQIYECKKAYITLMDKAEEVNNLQGAFSNLISEDDFKQLEALYQQLSNAYIDGTMTAEEALAVDLNSQISFYPEQEDGYFLLRNQTDFIIFANMVNGGTNRINAKLLTDVDLSKTEYPDLMIGTEAAEYAGIFDGCGHTITYHYENVSEKWRGLFAFVNGATIRNLRVEGSVYVTQIHYGALIGRAYGTVLVENVITDVDITGAMNQVTGDGGMLGANYANITFNNCATFGTMGYEGSSMYCGFVAWDNGGTTTTLNNCYTACTLTEGTGLDYCYTFCRTNGTVRMNNCYYLNQVGVAQGTKMTEEQFQSGEVCYKLNGDQSDPQWFQTIGEEAYPMPFPGAYVDFADGNYYNAIEKVAEEKTSSNDIYDLQGRKLEKISQKGIYIINRKKISVK